MRSPRFFNRKLPLRAGMEQRHFLHVTASAASAGSVQALDTRQTQRGGNAAFTIALGGVAGINGSSACSSGRDARRALQTIGGGAFERGAGYAWNFRGVHAQRAGDGGVKLAPPSRCSASPIRRASPSTDRLSACMAQRISVHGVVYVTTVADAGILPGKVRAAGEQIFSEAGHPARARAENDAGAEHHQFGPAFRAQRKQAAFGANFGVVAHGAAHRAVCSGVHSSVPAAGAWPWTDAVLR